MRKGEPLALAQGGRELFDAIEAGRTPSCDDQGRILHPFGMGS